MFTAFSEMDSRFEDINWDERIRLSKGQPNHPSYDPKWALFKQTNPQEKGVMDRYVNIKPWDHNRIRLIVPPGQLDYVNASAITLRSPSDASRPEFRYIAMQGPTIPSIPYVWRMIAEQVDSPIVIIQLTNNVENGAQKCSQYFPDGAENSEWTLNDADVWEDGWNATLKHESVEMICNNSVVKSRLSLRVKGERAPRTIWHFRYCRWPDFGVPADGDLDHFFDLMRLSREHSSPNGPRVVHCSAGVGRTGTFIALEHLVRELDVGAIYDPAPDMPQVSPMPMPDLVYDTVQDLRQQRKGMVQSEQQYRFLYQVLRKLWTDRNESNDDDEDETDGGVELTGSGSERAPKTTDTPDPYSDADADDDDDEGGARVRTGASTPAGS